MINMPGGPEIAVILVIALIVLGPQQLPKAMRTLGNAMAEIRKISNGFQAEMRSAMDAIETQADEKPTNAASSLPSPSPEVVDPDVTEVVARNPAPPVEAAASETPAANADGGDAAAPEPPPIDPADRAAG